jgi:hypothetical protein
MMPRIFSNFWASLFSIFFGFVFAINGTTTAQTLIAPPKVSPDSVAAMKTMLIQMWAPGKENRHQVDALFANTQRKNPELTLAYVANRLHDGRPKDALLALDSATVEHPNFLDGWLLKAHLDVLVDEYDSGLVGLRSAKRAFDEGHATQAQRTEFYQRTGELIGYLQAPVAAGVDQKLLNSTIEQLINRASDPDIATFHAAAETVRDQFSQKVKASQDRLAAELQKQAAVDVQVQTTLANQNQNLMQSEQTLRERLGQLQAEFAQQESQLVSQLSPLQSSAIELENQIQSLQLSLQLLYSDLAIAQNQPLVCPITVRSILDQIQRIESNLFGLQTSHQSFIAQYESVQLQIQSVRNQYQGQISEIQRELKRISGTVARNNSKLGKIAAGPKISSGKKVVETNRVSALSSYIKLPADLLRQDLLDQINSL